MTTPLPASVLPHEIKPISQIGVRTYCDHCDQLRDGCTLCSLPEQEAICLCPDCRTTGWNSTDVTEPPRRSSPARKTLSASEQLVEWLVPLAGWLFLIGIAWLAAHWVAPALKVSDPRTMASHVASRLQFFLAVSPMLPPDSIRFDERRAGNVVVYIESERFQSIPFPDRESFVKGAAHAWCSNLSGHPSEFLLVPTVRFRDIRTGDSLASYTCFAESWTSLENRLR
jgi:hypothetical protein